MYSLDANEARKADSTGGAIKELGKYVGEVTQAEDIKASTGTRGIALTFKASTGQTARLSLYTEKSDGERIMGFQMLMAMMTCMGLRDITPQPGTVKFWDNDAKQESTKKAQVFPALCKPIGVLLETEDYVKNDGAIGTRMVLKAVFQAKTELTASEILDRKTQPEQLTRMVAQLRHRPARPAKGAAYAPASAPAATTGGAASGFADMDDDIPFISASPMFDMVPSKQRRMGRYGY